MKTIINEIGIIDINKKRHPIFLKSGLNVITGKSSTGKSAIIEIVDYCFGNDEDTIPKGVITKFAEIFYLVITINSETILLARKKNLNKGLIQNLTEYDNTSIKSEIFKDDHYIDLDNYKKVLGSYFFDISDVDESIVIRQARGKRAPTPSIRSFMSFILQHQNLIANKHALFYRFDENNKREQVIEHTKVFLGFVDQNYYLLCQELEQKNTKLKQLQKEIENNRIISNEQNKKIEPLLNELYSIGGFKDHPVNSKDIFRTPELAKDKLDDFIKPNRILYTSDSNSELNDDLENRRSELVYELRACQRKIKTIKKVLKKENETSEKILKTENAETVTITKTVCPFCHSETNQLYSEAEKLRNAIMHLSNDIKGMQSSSILEKSLSEEKIKREALETEIKNITQQLNEIEHQNERLKKRKTLYENIIMIKAKLFATIDSLNLINNIELDEKCASLQKDIDAIKLKLSDYDFKSNLENASNKVNGYMKEIGKDLDFEETYKPINLKFSFETFELYHETPQGEKIYLRSMGSGANWLYSHITLFLALHKYFTELGSRCAIPSLLFLDQPTQVYFPNFARDYSNSFEEQKQKEQKERKDSFVSNNIEDDIKSVEKLFTLFADYCSELEKKYGFCPQLIVTDHADNIKLGNNKDFDSFVNGNRWRTRGFINPIPVNGENNTI